MDVYGRVSGSIGLLASGVTGTTWTDDGSATVGAAPPTAATSNAVQAVTQLARTAPDATFNILNTLGEITAEGVNIGLGPGNINNNLRVGYQAIYSNTTGKFLMALGAQSLYSNTIGIENTAVGQASGYSNISGDYNVFVGTSSGYTGTAYVSCTFIGCSGGNNNVTSGTGLIGIGAHASSSTSDLTNETVIGYNVVGKGSYTAYIAGHLGLYAEGPLITPNLQPTTFTTLAGTTAGNVQWQQYLQGAFKAFAAQALGYENDTATNQTITFPTPFANVPEITKNTTGLTISATTTTLTITAPNATTLFTGIIEVKGF
jgi:hypothetical protein